LRISWYASEGKYLVRSLKTKKYFRAKGVSIRYDQSQHFFRSNIVKICSNMQTTKSLSPLLIQHTPHHTTQKHSQSPEAFYNFCHHPDDSSILSKDPLTLSPFNTGDFFCLFDFRNNFKVRFIFIFFRYII
jgi:hypothetical protein